MNLMYVVTTTLSFPYALTFLFLSKSHLVPLYFLSIWILIHSNSKTEVMMKAMGFGGFNSSKGKKVVTNQTTAARGI